MSIEFIFRAQVLMDKDKQRQWGTVISPQSSSSGSPDSRRGDDSRSESAAKVLARDEAGERRWRVIIIHLYHPPQICWGGEY